MVCDAVGSVRVVARDGAGGAVTEHPALRLLARPSDGATGAEVLEALAGHLLLSGDAFLRVLSLDAEPRALHVLRPDRVRPVPDRNGWVHAYDYTTAGHVERIRVQDPDPDQGGGGGGEGAPALLHLRLFNPLDDHDGFPPLAAAGAALDLHNACARWNKALLDNSARPSGALVYGAADANLTPEQFERLKGELEEGFSGAGRAGRPMLLEGGLDWKAMSLSPRDMDFAEARNGAARDIALAFGVPPTLLGIPGDATYSNYAEAQRAFWRGTVLPLAGRILSGLGGLLAEHYGEELSFHVDMDRVTALAPEREALWRRIGEADFLSADEKRRALGLPPLEEAKPAASGEGAA